MAHPVVPTTEGKPSLPLPRICRRLTIPPATNLERRTGPLVVQLPWLVSIPLSKSAVRVQARKVHSTPVPIKPMVRSYPISPPPVLFDEVLAVDSNEYQSRLRFPEVLTS